MKKTLFLIGTFLLIQFGVASIFTTIKLSYNIVQNITQGNIDLGSISTDVPSLSAAEIILLLFVCNALTVIASILLCRKGFAAPFKWHSAPAATGRTAIIALSIAAMLPLMYFTNAVTELIGLPDIMANQFMEMCEYPFWAICVIAILAPLAEELCFRYGVCNAMLESKLRHKLSPKWLKVLAIVVSSLLFGTIHMNPAQILGALILGLFLGWLYVKSRSIWPSLICHILNNALALAIMLSMPPEQKMQDITPDISIFASLIVGAAILAGILIWWLNRIITKFSIAQDAAPLEK